MKFLKLEFIYEQKVLHFALRDVFIYKNPNNSKKARQFALRFLIYKKHDTLRYAVFYGIFDIGGGGGHFYKQKTMHFPLNFYIQKTMHFPLRFYI